MDLAGHERFMELMKFLVHLALLLERLAQLRHFLYFGDAPELLRADQTTRHNNPPTIATEHADS
jgi:hypothetical protein